MRDALQAEIQSERLILRDWRPSDAEALFALLNNWEVVRWLSLPPWPCPTNASWRRPGSGMLLTWKTNPEPPYGQGRGIPPGRHSDVPPTVIPISRSFGLIAAKTSRKRSDGIVSSIAT
jgi:hypothetical protein